MVEGLLPVYTWRQPENSTMNKIPDYLPDHNPVHVMRRCALLGILVAGWACTGLERDNPLDPSSSAEQSETSTLSLAVPLPKILATVVDSLVATLEIPDAPTVVKELSYDTPLGPALLTIGALSPSTGVTLTIEGFDLDGRLILSGTQTDIIIVADDTTRISIDLRLAIPLDELDTGGDPTGGDTGGGDTGGEDTGGTDGTDTGDTGGTDTGDTGGTDTGDGTTG